MASAEAGYATELADARARLLKLKDRAAARARALGNAVTPSQRDILGDSNGASAVADRTTDANGLEDSGPASELQKLVAAFLLDPANGVPLDSHKIHREVLMHSCEALADSIAVCRAPHALRAFMSTCTATRPW